MGSTKKEIVIEDYANLVKAVASKYVHLGLPFDDLQQEGMIGLLEAKERFDETREVAFSTYATFWVKKRILESISKETQESGNTVAYNDALDSGVETAVPQQTENSAQDTSGDEEFITIPADFPQDERTVLNLHFNEKKTLNEIAFAMNISREKVRQLKQKALRRIRVTLVTSVE